MVVALDLKVAANEGYLCCVCAWMSQSLHVDFCFLRIWNMFSFAHSHKLKQTIY